MLVRSPISLTRAFALCSAAMLVAFGIPRSTAPASASSIALGSLYCGEAGGPTKKYTLTNGLPGSSVMKYDGLGFSLTAPPPLNNGLASPVLYGQISNLLNFQSDQINAYLAGQTTPYRTINLPSLQSPLVFEATGGLAVDASGLLYVGVQYASALDRRRSPSGAAGHQNLLHHLPPPRHTRGGSFGYASVAIYAQNANGTATPIQVLNLPGEYINGIALDENGTLYALDGNGASGLDPAIYVFTSPLTNPSWQRKLIIGKYGFYFGIGLAYLNNQLYTSAYVNGSPGGGFINIYDSSGSGKVNPVRQITSSTQPQGPLAANASYIYQGYQNGTKCDVFVNGNGTESPVATVTLPRTDGNTGPALGP